MSTRRCPGDAHEDRAKASRTMINLGIRTVVQPICGSYLILDALTIAIASTPRGSQHFAPLPGRRLPIPGSWSLPWSFTKFAHRVLPRPRERYGEIVDR